MDEHGRSTLPTDENGRIMDRLAGLEKVIPPSLVCQVLQDTGRVNGRACILTHEVMFWVVLAMGLLTHLPIRQVFRHARRMGLGQVCPARSSLCEGRKRLGLEPLLVLHAAIVKPLAILDTPGAFYRQWRLMGFDGTVMDVPDSEANAVFGRSSGSRGEGAFPQVRKVSLVELGTHRSGNRGRRLGRRRTLAGTYAVRPNSRRRTTAGRSGIFLLRRLESPVFT